MDYATIVKNVLNQNGFRGNVDVVEARDGAYLTHKDAKIYVGDIHAEIDSHLASHDFYDIAKDLFGNLEIPVYVNGQLFFGD